MLNQLQKHIHSRLPFLKTGKLLIAISGGLDSVVLVNLCHQLNLNIALAHCNFNLRGAESDGDEDLVMQLAEKLDLEVFVESFDTVAYAQEHKLNIQLAARELRYNWFQELSDYFNFDFILTAHHADDNLETFLINLSRGTGLDGLTGIPEINDNIVRLLLPFSRQDLEAFAIENKLKWRDDSSNASKKYVRNKLRHDVIPVLKEINPMFLQNFQKTLSNLNDTADIVDESLNAVAKRAINTLDGSGVSFKISEFKKVNNPKAYLFEIFKDYGFTQWDDVVDLLDAQSGKLLFSETYRLLKDRDCLILTEIHSEGIDSTMTISSEDKNVKTPLGLLSFDETDTIEKEDRSTIYIDKMVVSFPLTIRKWQEGDYFYPSGMKGKKKLSKYFKDEKMSLIDKEHVLLLCSGNDIVWVVGKRGDERFRVTENTENILKIALK